MRLGWILISIFFLIVLIQSKKILTFIGIELGVFFREQVNFCIEHDFIVKEE